jgi:aspartate-semialdehyde dehydrogenase
VRAALAERRDTGSRVELFGHGRDVAVLSEYDGEARIVQPATELDAHGFAALFVCEAGHDAGALAAAVRSGSVVVDLSGTLDGPVVAIPHPLTLLVEPLLAALHRALGITDASVFVMRPASDFGESGLEELREQTVHLLRFEPTPTEIFGRQLAFSVIPEHLFPSGEERAGARIAADCRSLLGSAAMPLSVSLALVPTFLGHAIALHVGVAHGDAAAARNALAGVSGLVLAEDSEESGTTLDAPESAGLSSVRVEDAGAGRLRLWAIGAEPGALAAERAMAAASDAGVLVNVS